MSDGRGRPRKYARQIEAIKVEDGWVAICQQKARTAGPGYRQRYPGFEFRSVPNPIESADKPWILEARRAIKEGK